MTRPRYHTLQEIFDCCSPEPNAGCWLWLKATSGGYARFRQGKKDLLMHRRAYELSKGPIPPGLQIDHLCRQRSCVNPQHLRVVTPRENTLAGFGPTAMHARATHCPQGHEYTPENVRMSRGRRHCKACGRVRAKMYYWAHIKEVRSYCIEHREERRSYGIQWRLNRKLARGSVLSDSPALP